LKKAGIKEQLKSAEIRKVVKKGIEKRIRVVKRPRIRRAIRRTLPQPVTPQPATSSPTPIAPVAAAP